MSGGGGKRDLAGFGGSPWKPVVKAQPCTRYMWLSSGYSMMWKEQTMDNNFFLFTGKCTFLSMFRPTVKGSLALTVCHCKDLKGKKKKNVWLELVDTDGCLAVTLHGEVKQHPTEVALKTWISFLSLSLPPHPHPPPLPWVWDHCHSSAVRWRSFPPRWQHLLAAV